MIKILLDTNIFLDRKDWVTVDEKISELTKMIENSNQYKIMVHPLSFEYISNIKNLKERKFIDRKIKIYNIIEKPLKVSDEFNKLIGISSKHNDDLENNLLYAIYKDCASYLITNNSRLKNKAKKIKMEDRVLGIDDAIKLFKLEEKKVKTPNVINLRKFKDRCLYFYLFLL